jgi:uncharacterized protein YkwD
MSQGMRRARRLALVLFLGLLVLASAACTPEEGEAFTSVNTLREANHLPALGWNDGAYEKAVAWSNHMADEGRLSHSVLREGVPAGWRILGENVAYAGSVAQAMAALEASPPHRANLLNPLFSSIAVGIVERDGRVWVTEVFIG